VPLTAKGAKIRRHMVAQYGSEKKADQVLYASENKGTITGIHKGKKLRRKMVGQ